jgi:hypothetical protein
MHAGGLTPFVGRDEEMDLLQRRWQQAKAGSGRVVLLLGEPGIGESRITAALLDGGLCQLQPSRAPPTILRFVRSPMG